MNLDSRLLRQAGESRGLILLTVAAGLAGGLLTVLQARLFSRVVSRVFLGSATLEAVSGSLGALLGVILLRAASSLGGEVSASAAARRVKMTLRALLFRHILKLGPAYTSGERTGELSGLLVEGIEALEAYYSQYLPGVILAALLPLTVAAFILPLDPLSGVILLVTAPLIPLFMTLIGNTAQALTHKQWRTLNRMRAYFLDVIQGLTTLKALGRSRAQTQVIAQVSERFRQTTMGVLRVTFLSALALELVSTLSTAVVAVEIGLRLLYGRLSFEQAFFVLLLAPEFYLPLRMLGARFHAGMAGVAAAKSIFAVLETPIPAEAETSRPAPRRSSFAEIHFENVAFAYPGGEAALHGVDLSIGAGEKVALVGPSGSGKSTIASLLLGFVRPTAGEIRVDGRPLEGTPAAEWRANLAWMPQKPYLFYDTVAANIRLACPEASPEAVEQAARLAHAHEFIQELPQGYQTLIGERGARLSGGQAQRLALARAFLRDAPLLILDEATSSLDPEHEMQLGDSLAHLLEGRAALIIAHRLGSIARADRVYVLESGKVTESGAPEELSGRGGPYSCLVKAALEAQAAETEEAEGTASGFSSEDRKPPRASSGAVDALADNRLRARIGGYSSALAVLSRLLKLAAPLWGWIGLSALSGFATVASSIGLMSAAAYIIAAAALHPSIAALQVAIVGVRFFGISRGVFRYLERYLSHQVTFRLLGRLRVWFYQALEPLAPARLMRYRSGDLLTRLATDINSLEDFYVRALAPPLVALLVSLGAFSLLAAFLPRLGFTLLGFLLLSGAGLPAAAYMLGRKASGRMVAERSALNTALVESLQGLPDLTAFGQLERRIDRVGGLSRGFDRSQRQMAFVQGLQTAAGGFLAGLCAWTVLTLAIPRVAAGEMPGVYLAALVLIALTAFEAITPLPGAAQQLQGHLEAARRLFEVVDEPSPEVTDAAIPLGATPISQERPQRADFNLEVENLSFGYPDEFPPPDPARQVALPLALEDISFSLPPGKRLAVVGPSGCGKSTLVNLLLRFWEYRRGSIRLGGGELHLIPQELVREHLAVVPQDTYLFSASLGDNLRLARATASQDEIERAARAVRMHDFIAALPEGYATWAGEHGGRLSAGERQRLAIGRALLKGAPILLLDEPTANLDVITEREVLGEILRLTQGCSLILATHRLVGMEAMDEILVLSQGCVVERGRHVELLAAGGTYRRLWEAQRQYLVS